MHSARRLVGSTGSSARPARQARRLDRLDRLVGWSAGRLVGSPAGTEHFAALQHGGGLGPALAVSVRAASTNNFYF